MSLNSKPIDTPQTVTLASLPPGELILVETQNSEYRVQLRDPRTGSARIEGGRAFPTPAEVHIAGAAGAGLLKLGSINVGLGMEILTGDTYHVTSAVRTIRLVPPAASRRHTPETSSGVL